MDDVAAAPVEGNEKPSRNELAGVKHAVHSSGRVLRDNVWGPHEEDATRRDFTINAMYYDPETRTVVDYHGGIKDAKKRVLRMIGDPVARYREDPVRIIPAVRDGWQRRLSQKMHPFPALQDAIDDVFDARIGDVSGRGKLGADMREIWMMQPRFEKRSGNTPFTMVEQPRFRAGFDFMRLRSDV